MAVRVANVLLAANVVAQSCCNYAVITRDQRGHAVEESIWTLSAIAIVFVCFQSWRAPRKSVLPPANAAFLRGALLFGPLYIAFMAAVDVPMYVRRSLDDLAANTRFLGFFEGLADTARCARFTRDDAFWTVEMPWMSLYFTLAVWAALWIAFSDIQFIGPATGEKATGDDKIAAKKTR